MSKTLLTFTAVAVLLSGTPALVYAGNAAMTNEKMMAEPAANGAMMAKPASDKMMMEKKAMKHKKMKYKAIRKDAMDKGMMNK
jgi:hypothetical protein